jgi:hypothetical protein
MITSTECERKAACPNPSPLLQPLLGTDKRNPVFTVYRAEPSAAASLHVYYGAELLEVVPEDRRSPAFKLLVGRLYNAGVKAVTLQQSFGVDRKTMQRWGRALQSEDPQQLVQALAGRGPRKLTPEIRAFVTMRFPQIYSQSRAGYSQRVRAEMEAVFGLKLSGECLRLLFQQLKAELRHELSEPVAAAPVGHREMVGLGLPEPSSEVPIQTEERDKGSAPAGGTAAGNRETTCDCLPEPPPATGLHVEAQPGSPPPRIRNPSPVLPAPAPAQRAVGFCHHLGVLLFSSLLLDLEKQTATSGWLLKQWLATLLLGAVNIEQTKLLDFQDLERLLGHTLRSLFPQRSQLSDLAATATVTSLLGFNARRVRAAQVRDFYFDPHTKHYTGQQHVLKGWCARIRWADKVLHSDFFHTAAGQPVYLDCADNYQDMRERFAVLLPRFRQEVGLPAEAVVTCVIDRGIFSHEVFTHAIEAPNDHLITWEKNYRRGQWDPQMRSGQCVLERTRNHAQDLRVYRFEYLDQPWAKNPQMRQLIVRATNPQGRTVEVAILTDDRQRPGPEIICLMFNRWIQENDFKYLDQHFGINEITSYASVAYERLQDQLQAKQIKSGAYKALEQQVAQVKSQLSRLLLAEHQHPGRCARRTERIATLSLELKKVQHQQAHTEKEVSRLEALIQQQMVRLDTRNKRLLDSLKLIARNAFYQALQPFKQAYNNYRDDHELFRNLTQADGLLAETAEHVDAYLLPTVNYPPKLDRIVQRLLAELNATHPLMPDDSGRPLRLHLGDKSGFQVAIVS